MITFVTCFTLMASSMVFAADLKGIIVGDQATVRSGNGFDQSSLGALSIGSSVSVLNVKDDWYQVAVDNSNMSGWIFKDLVALQHENGLPTVKKARVNATMLNVRIAPSLEAHRVTQLNNGQEVKVINTDQEWVQILLNDGQKGWVHGEYLVMVPNLPSAAVNKDDVKVYSKINAAFVEISQFPQGLVVYISDYDEEYFEIQTEDDIFGWIKRADVSLIINGENPVSRGSLRADASDFISITKKYLGKPYKYATAGPNSFDCSGYVYYILNKYYGTQLKEHGIQLPRSSRTMVNVGTPVSKSNLEVGDLVFFNNSSGTINHVGFYIGNNQFIHASSGSSMSVIVSPINTGTYNTRYNTARRLF